MLVASKYEELIAPTIQDFVNLGDDTFTKDDVLAFEFRLLAALDFDVAVPTMYRFLERYHSLVSCHEDDVNRSYKVFLLATYLADLCLHELKLNKWKPSLLASAILYLTHKMLKVADPWPAEIIKQSGNSELLVRDCARDICPLL